MLNNDHTVTRETLPLFRKRVWPTSREKQGSQMVGRESDCCIVPMKQGNACRGKADNRDIALVEET